MRFWGLSSFTRSCFSTPKKGGTHRKHAVGSPFSGLGLPKGPLRSKKWDPQEAHSEFWRGPEGSEPSSHPVGLPRPAPATQCAHQSRYGVCPAASCASRSTSRSVLGFRSVRMGTFSSYFSRFTAATPLPPLLELHPDKVGTSPKLARIRSARVDDTTVSICCRC